LLSCLQVEIYVFADWRPPSWISDFRLRRTVFSIVPLDVLPPENLGVAVGISFLSCLRAEIYGGGNHTPRHFTCFYTDSRGSKCFLKFLQKDVEVSSPEEAFLKNSSGKKYGV